MANEGSKPVALITTFEDAVLPVILAEIAAGPQPPVADWFVGTFGISPSTATQVAATPGCRHAPVFGIQPGTSKHARKGRQVSSADAAKLDPAHQGEIPGTSAGQVIPPGDRRAWGLELGRRFRDELRSHSPVDVWQFDEVLGQCATDLAHREFVGGVLAGLHQGRPELGDRPQSGFIWVARTAMTGLPHLTIDSEVQEFWNDLDRAALFLVGEEYPPFTGAPADAARTFADAHQALLGGGPIRKSLGQRYITGMTPGFHIRGGSPPKDLGVGGNVDGKPDAFVSTWRTGFIDGRISRQRPCGFAHFNFVVENAVPEHRVRDAVQSLHHAARRLGQ
ncbi:MAG: hypothetical protein ACXVRU_10590 [Gaiellaceae bacterium]